MSNARDIIVRPLITEKTMKLQEADNKVTFEVAKGSNKTQVKIAVEEIFNVKVEKAVNQTSAKEAIPTNQSDPDEKSLTNNGNTTFKFKFEIPVGPGYSQTRGDAKGQVVEQTLENLLKNVDFGL